MIALFLSTMLLVSSATVASSDAITERKKAEDQALTAFRFQGTLGPLGHTSYPLAVNGTLNSLSTEFSGKLEIDLISITAHPPQPCFSGPVNGTLQAARVDQLLIDVVLAIPGTLAPTPNSAPFAPNCPVGRFTLDVHVFTGQATLTLIETTNRGQWVGTVSLTMLVGTNTVHG